MTKSTALIVISMVLGIAFLSYLGNWQVERMAWKEQLISMTQARAAGEAQSLAQIEKIWASDNDVGYMKVTLNGRFDHAKEMYYYNTLKGQAGWNVITPLFMADNRIALVNRGFVPLALKDIAKRQDGQIKGNVIITGLARNPIYDKPNSLLPENDLPKRELFWKSHSQMAALVGDKTELVFLPFMVDAGKNQIKGRYPIGGTTRMEFPNNHLQYAATWYGLALSLFGVGSFFLYTRRKQAA